MSLVERGELSLHTTARSVLGTDLPLIDDRVTVEQLLAHRSGIGDYLDEDEVADGNDYALTVPVHELATTEQFLAVLDGHAMKHEPGERLATETAGLLNSSSWGHTAPNSGSVAPTRNTASLRSLCACRRLRRSTLARSARNAGSGLVASSSVPTFVAHSALGAMSRRGPLRTPVQLTATTNSMHSTTSFGACRPFAPSTRTHDSSDPRVRRRRCRSFGCCSPTFGTPTALGCSGSSGRAERQSRRGSLPHSGVDRCHSVVG